MVTNGKPALALGALAALTWPGLDARAAWEIVPEIGLTSEVDDNARLLPEDQPNSTRTALDARVRVRSFSERGEAYIEPRIVADAYSDPRDEPLENEDAFFIARAMRRFENSNLNFRYDYSRQSVLRSEIADALLGDLAGEPVTDAGGTTFGTFTDERERSDIGLDYEWSLSQRTNMRLETSLIDVAYLENQSTARSDFDSARLAAVLTRLVDQRNEVSASLYVSDFDAARNDNQTTTVGVQGSFLRPLSLTWNFALDAGVARADYRFLDDSGRIIDNANNYFTFGFQFDQRSETTTWTIGAGRSLSPSNDGFLARRDDVRLQVRHRMTPRLTMSAGLRIAQYDRVAAIASGSDQRDYGRLSFQVDWLMTPRWTLTTGIDRVTQEYAGVGAEAESNAVIVGIRYRGLSNANAQSNQGAR